MPLGNEPLFRRLAEHSLVGIYIIQDGRFAYCNPKLAETFGYTVNELLALNNWQELIAPPDRELVASRVGRRLVGLEDTARYPFRCLHRDGSIREVEVYASRSELNGRPAVLGNLIDVTEQHRSAMALRESEALFRRAFDDTNLPMVLTDLSHRFVRLNAAFARLFGYAPDEMLGMSVAQITYPDDLTESYERRKALLAGEATYFQMEKRYLHRDGHVIWALTNVSLVNDANGQPYLYIGQVQDITQRKQLEIERTELLTRLQLQISRMPLGYLLFDSQFRLADWNPAATRIFGYQKEEITGMGPPFEKIIPANERPVTDAIIDRIRAGDMTAHSTNDNLTKDGNRITCEWINTPLVTPDGKFEGVVSLAQDVTEQKRLEQQLRQSQKMEAVGVLAGGVAHDFNNLLTVINGYSELLLDDQAVSSASREMVREIRQAGDRASALTRQLLAFSRKQVLAPQIIDLNELVREMAKMLNRLIGADIELATSLSSTCWRIQADPGQIEQVMMNLVVNARDAMPRGGKLTLETRNVKLTEEYARQHVNVKPGRYVRFAVTDTGIGMDESTKSRIFEPFFTTKEPGKGTGLGLSTVHGIVRQSGGHVEVYSESDHGTTFKVYFPALQEDATSRAMPSVILEVPRGTETILLAEDDDSIRHLAKIALQSCGYSVLEAANGEQALKSGSDQSTAIQVVITDVVMPRMSGRELVEHIRIIRPDIKVLYISGYTDDAIVRHGIVEEGVAFLHKPFTPTMLARKVREVLDSSASRFG